MVLLLLMVFQMDVDTIPVEQIEESLATLTIEKTTKKTSTK